MSILLYIITNLIVGACVGMTGIAGFLLPMYYTGFAGMASTPALALSFAAFLVSGVLGSVTYYKTKNLNLKVAVYLSIGSFIGALLGVRINLLIPEAYIRILLYLVVLISGISILLRKESSLPDRKNPLSEKNRKRNLIYILLGLVTGTICAASGAGGPVLVMPLLTLLGFPAHTAVGISLFDSIFIALPATWGYLGPAMSQDSSILSLLPLILVAHGIGVIAGSKNAVKINQLLLKRIVAVASILIALMKLLIK